MIQIPQVTILFSFSMQIKIQKDICPVKIPA